MRSKLPAFTAALVLGLLAAMAGCAAAPKEKATEPSTVTAAAYKGVMFGGRSGSGFSTEITFTLVLDGNKLLGNWGTTDGDEGTIVWAN